MLGYLALIGGLMATLSTWGEGATIIGIPEPLARPAQITTVLPVGATGTFTEAGLGVETTSTSTNVTDPSGLEGATPYGVGTPSSSLWSYTATVKDGGTVNETASFTATTGSSTFGQTPTWMLHRVDTVRASLAGAGYRKPRAIELPNGKIVSIHEDWESAGTDNIYSQTWSPTTKSWGSPVLVASIAGGNPYPLPFSSGQPVAAEIWTIPAPASSSASGVAIWVGWWNTASATQIQFTRSYSLDDGATWSAAIGSGFVLTFTGLTYDETRVRYEGSSQTLWMVLRRLNGATYTGLTYKSHDFGASWENVSAMDRTDMVRADMWSYCNAVYLAWIANGGTAILVDAATGGSAEWTSMTTDASTTSVDSGYLAAAVQPNGRASLFFRKTGEVSSIYGIDSVDAGANWGSPSATYPPTGGGSQEIVNDQAGAAAFTSGHNFHGAAYSGGRIHLLGNLTSVASGDYSIADLIFGDRSTVSITRYVDGAVYNNFAAYYPSDTPATKGGGSWGALVGTVTESRVVTANGRIAWNLDATNDTGYSPITTAATDNAVSLLIALSDDSSYNGLIPVARLAANDGAGNEVIVELHVDFTAQTVRLYDVVAAAYLGAAAVDYGGGDAEFFVDLDGSATALKVSAWARTWAADSLTEIVSGATVATQAGASNYIRIGKCSATTAVVDILYAIPASTAGLARGDTTSTRVGIPAMADPDYLILGVSVYWAGSPLIGLNSWTLAASSETPVTRINPWSLEASPELHWVSATGASGAVEYIIYDLGSSYKGKISTNLVCLGYEDFEGCEELTLATWDGAAFTNRLTLTGHFTPFGAAGAVGWSRVSTSSYTFIPNGVNGNPQTIAPGEWVGRWCIIADDNIGTNMIGGTVASCDPGQFTDTSNTLGASITLDPTTVVVLSGTLVGMGTAKTTGTIFLYPRRAVAFGTVPETTRYIRIGVQRAEGKYANDVGLVIWGPAHPMARQETSGSKMTLVGGRSDLNVVPGSGIAQSQQIRRIAQRRLVFPYRQQITHAGQYSAGTAVDTIGYSNVARAQIDGNLMTLEGLHKFIGLGAPVVMAQHLTMTGEPGTTAQVAWGEDVIVGYLDDGFSRSAEFGFLTGPGSFEHAGDLSITEAI